MQNVRHFQAFVDRALADGRPPVLRNCAERIEACLRRLGDDPPPPGLQGLSAFALSAAMDRLHAAAASASPPGAA